MLTLGIPRETLCEEKRVALTPAAVKELTASGACVWVEAGAGLGSGFSDLDYQRAGAATASNREELYHQARFIQKVKQPLPPEYSLLKSHHVLFSFLHLVSKEQSGLLEALVKSGATAIGYESYRVDGRLPILAPMSEIAGGLSMLYAACIQSLVSEEREKIEDNRVSDGLRKVAEKYPHRSEFSLRGHVGIFGAGVAGMAAFNMARHWAGVHAAIFESDPSLLRSLLAQGITAFAMSDSSKQALQHYDVLVGAAHVPGEKAPLVLDDKFLAFISRTRPKLMLDIAIDQGGNFPMARSTSYAAPVYRDPYQNIRFAVPNIPSWAGRSASEAISSVTLPLTRQLIFNFEKSLMDHRELLLAVNIRAGKILKPSLQSARQK